MTRKPWLMLAAILSFWMAVSGCSEPTGPKTVKSKDLDVKIPAMKHAVETKDQSAVPELVRDLDSDDPAVRLYSIQSLQRLTGEDFGYRYYDDREARKAALAKWQHWLEERKH
jgi:hypothetical protein